jgi:hypothetical protein
MAMVKSLVMAFVEFVEFVNCKQLRAFVIHVRSWVLECFTPAKAQTASTGKMQMIRTLIEATKLFNNIPPLRQVP